VDLLILEFETKHELLNQFCPKCRKDEQVYCSHSEKGLDIDNFLQGSIMN
jgi:hypothetical protein